MAPAAQSTAPLKTDWSERYELIGKIGSGGFAEVYEAQDTVLDRRVALKIAPGGHDMTARVLREVQAAAALSYPGIVALYDWFTDGERSYIVWELVQGDSLDRLPERLGDGDVVALGIELMEALAHAHSQGIVHRDIKPQNVMLDEAGHVKVMDFGIALLSDTDTLTGEGDVIGTVAYMSPEQAAGRRVGPPTDVYSAGMVLYELLAGEHPLRGETPAQTLANVSAARLPSLGTLRPDLPEELVALIDEACSERPGARPTAAELGAALDELRESGVLFGRRLERLQELVRPLLRIGPAVERAGGAGLATVAGMALLRALPAYPQTWTLPLLAAGVALWAVVPQAGLAWLLGMLAFPFFNVAFSVGIAYLVCAVTVFLLARTRPIIVVWPALAPLLAPVYLSLLAPATAFVFGRLRGPLAAAWAGVVVFVVMLLTRERGMLSAFEARRPLAGTVAGAGDPVTVVLRLLESLVPAGLAQAGAWAIVAVALGFAFRTPGLEQRLWIWSLSFSGLYVFYALMPPLVLGESVDLTVLTLNVAAVAGVILLPLTLMAGGEPEEQDDEHLQGD